MKNCLVTAIGSMSADCVINSLKNAGCKVIGCDIYPKEWHVVSKVCDNFYQVPLVKDKDVFIESIISICKNEEINYILPLTDIEIDVFNQYRLYFSENNIILCMPSLYSLEISRDKYRLYEFFKDDIHVPSVWTAMALDYSSSKVAYPVIAKPKNGRSSEGLKLLFSDLDYQSLSPIDNYIIQEFKDGNIFTVDFVRSSESGNAFCIPREELLRTKNGAGLTVRMFQDIELVALVEYIGHKLDINGCINMEFILNDGKYYLIDINPRFSAGVAFSSLQGYNMPLSHLHCFMGYDILSAITVETCIATKKYCEEII